MDKSSILTTISCLKAERAKELGIEFSQVFVLIILIFFVQLRRLYACSFVKQFALNNILVVELKIDLPDKNTTY